MIDDEINMIYKIFENINNLLEKFETIDMRLQKINVRLHDVECRLTQMRTSDVRFMEHSGLFED